MTSFNLDMQLARDTIGLGKYDLCQIRLHKNALYPWFILVPEVAATEFYELSPDDQTSLIALINQMSKLVKQAFPVEKLNIATIGNVVEQMHIHVIGRHSNDACWPGTIWGDEAFTAYTTDDVRDIQQKLIAELGDSYKPEAE